MLVVVTGGSASGKSQYAEELLTTMAATRKLYIATMIPWDEESKIRVKRHQHMRREKSFETWEQAVGLGTIDLRVPMAEWAEEGSVAVLLECMSNLVANEQYIVGGSEDEIHRRILDGISHLQRQAGDIIIVTNEVFSDSMVYGEETIRYQALLGRVNQSLSAMADQVTEVVYGIPVLVKYKG